MKPMISWLKQVFLPYRTPEQAIRAFMTLVSYSRNLEILYETPKDVPVEFTVDRERLRSEFEQIIRESESVLSEGTSKIILESYGISTTKTYKAVSAKEAVAIAQNIGYPVVLKIDSPDITHKSDVGGVMLNVAGDLQVTKAFKQITEVVALRQPSARINGVTVQRMFSAKDAVELILGIKKDKIFGTVLMVGMGGITAELFGDKALGFPPLNESLARRMLESLKIYPLLKGYRGSNPKNIDQLIQVLIRLSYLAADYPEILELDINPLLVTPAEAIVLDGRIIIDQKTMRQEKSSICPSCPSSVS